MTSLRSALATRAPWMDLVGLGGALVTLTLYFAVTTDHFFTLTNAQTIANQIPADLIIAVGMTFVLISGGIDLSVGSVFALSSAVLGVALVRGHWPLPAAFLLAVAAGTLCGAANATVIAAFRVPSFIVTLGMLEIARGATYLLTESQTQYLGVSIEKIVDASLGGISLPFAVAVAIVIIGHVVLQQTRFGRYLLAMGQNEEAAWLSGINTVRMRWAAFCLAGTLAGVASILQTARLAAADPNAGIGLELKAIAAVVIGGTSLSGGRGSVLRSAVGVIIVAVLGSGLAQADAQEPLKRIVTGLVIVAAVVVDQLRYRRR